MSSAIKAIGGYRRFLQAVANRPGILTATFIGSWLSSALIFHLLEEFGKLDSLYWSAVTMSTVGYGDISPQTDAGKIFTILFVFYSIVFIVPLAITAFTEAHKINKKELTHREQEYIIAYVKADAAANGYDIGDEPPDYDE